MALALEEFVDKDENDALGEMVKLQLRDTQKTMSTKKFRDEDLVNVVIKETERSRAEEPSQEEIARTRKVLTEYLLFKFFELNLSSAEAFSVLYKLVQFSAFR